ncbi:MAG: MauE/DoxX family redox-associated membrane protein [Ktedonobacteraceae bacterium]
MPLSIAFMSVRLFLRLLLGVLLLSVGMSKFARLRQFQQGIQEYQVLPSTPQSKRAFSMVLATGIPLAELLAGLGLLSGFWLVPAIVLAIALFVVFCIAITINLVRGRRDLSCHCGGAIGNHLISWWLVGRNGLFIIGLVLLLATPPDSFTVASFVRSPSLLNASFVNTIVPVAVLVGAVVAIIVLCNAARVLRRS